MGTKCSPTKIDGAIAWLNRIGGNAYYITQVLDAKDNHAELLVHFEI